MNLRCIYCQTPFTLGRMEKLTAIQKLQAENLHHYDAFCPRCRRSNPVSIDRLRIFTPGWQEGLRTLEADAAQTERAMPSTASVFVPNQAPTKAEAVEQKVSKKHHHTKAAAKPAAKAKTVKKPAAKAKTTTASKAKPAATTKKSTAKPAAKPKAPAKKAPSKSKK